MRITTNKCFKYRKIAGEYYLIPTAEAAEKWKTPLKLTETAAWIWTMLEAGKSREAVIKEMPEEFDVDPVEAGAAVERFCRELLRQGLLVETV